MGLGDHLSATGLDIHSIMPVYRTVLNYYSNGQRHQTLTVVNYTYYYILRFYYYTRFTKIDSPFLTHSFTIPNHTTMPSYIPDKKPRAIAASTRFFPTLHLPSFPNLTPYFYNNNTTNNNNTTPQPHDEWPRYLAFLISSIIQLQHSSNIFDLHQLNALLQFISNQPDLCRICFTHHHIPSTPNFAFETLLLNTTILSNTQHQLFLPFKPHLFVQHIYSQPNS